MIAFPLCGYILDNLEWEVDISIGSNLRLDISANFPRWKILQAGNLRAGKVLLEMLEKWKFLT